MASQSESLPVAIFSYGTWTTINYKFFPEAKNLTACARILADRPSPRQKDLSDLISFALGEQPDIRIKELVEVLTKDPELQSLTKAVAELDAFSVTPVSTLLAKCKDQIARSEDILHRHHLAAFASHMKLSLIGAPSIVSLLHGVVAKNPSMTVAQLVILMHSSGIYALQPIGKGLMDLAIKLGVPKPTKYITFRSAELDSSGYCFCTTAGVPGATTIPSLSDMCQMISEERPDVILVIGTDVFKIGTEVYDANGIVARIQFPIDYPNALVIISMTGSADAIRHMYSGTYQAISFESDSTESDRALYMKAFDQFFPSVLTERSRSHEKALACAPNARAMFLHY
jgi:hypothetical protein